MQKMLNGVNKLMENKKKSEAAAERKVDNILEKNARLLTAIENKFGGDVALITIPERPNKARGASVRFEPLNAGMFSSTWPGHATQKLPQPILLNFRETFDPLATAIEIREVIVIVYGSLRRDKAFAKSDFDAFGKAQYLKLVIREDGTPIFDVAQ